MHLRKSSLTLAAAAAALFSSQSRAAEVSGELTLASAYVHNGLKAGDLVLHPTVEASFGDFYAGVWGVRQLEDRGAEDGFADAFDFYAGYGVALDDKWALDFGATYSNTVRDGRNRELYLGTFGELGTFTPSLYFTHDVDTDDWIMELASTVALPLEGFPAETTFKVGRFLGEEDYTWFEVEAVYPWELSDASQLDLGVSWVTNDHGGEEPGDQFVFRLSFSHGF